MLDRETRKKVEILNANLGTRHRTKPYDMDNAADLKDALTMAAAAYRDYRYYAGILSGVDEDFDESLENFDTASWINKGTPEADALSNKCVDSLETTCDLFDALAERAEENCISVLKTVLSKPIAMQKAVLGRAYKINPEAMDEKINDLLDALAEAEYYHPIHENFDAFIKMMGEVWGPGE